MEIDATQVILGALSMAATVGVALIGFRQRVAEKRADARRTARETEATAAQALIDQYQDEVRDIRARFGSDVEHLTGRLAAHGARIAYLESGIRQLIRQMRDEGMDPVWVPNGEHQIGSQ